MKKTNNNIFFEKPKQSRFLVNLSYQEPKEIVEENQEANEISLWSKLQKTLKEVDVATIGHLEDKSQKDKESFWSKIDGRFSGLAFYGLLKFIFQGFYKVGYYIGWSVIFTFRFCFIFISEAITHLAKKLSIDYSSFGLVFIKFVYFFGEIISSPFRKTREEKTSELIIHLDNHKKKKIFDFRKIIKNTKKFYSNFRWSVLLPNINFLIFRNLLPFAIALIIVVFPFFILVLFHSVTDMKGRVMGESISGVNELFEASKSASKLNFNEANKNFSKAGEKFFQAQQELSDISVLLSILTIVPNKEIKLAAQSEDILLAGQAAASLGNNLSLAISTISSSTNLAVSLKNFTDYSRKATIDAKSLRDHVSRINSNLLPQEQRNKFQQLQEKSIYLESSLTEFTDIVESLSVFLGTTQDKRYLLVFQNNSEIRATGGFIGSYALVDFKNGKIKNIEAPGGGSYDTEAGLNEKIIAPKPLQLVNPLWHFWDANWWPDWNKSAKKLAWFYEKSDGSTVDGVISFTPKFIEDILRVIGPIDMSKDYGTTINADNFWITAQTFSEQKPATTNKPKKFIGDLMNKIFEITPTRLNKNTLIGLAQITENNFDKKQILLYFTDDQLQKKVDDYDWGGKIKNSPSDYLMVVNSNIAGGKSDKKIRQTIKHHVDILSDGSIIDEVNIIREHTGEKQELFVGQRNVNYLRVYVPKGSQLISASGFIEPDQSLFEHPDESWKNDQDLQVENNAFTDPVSGVKIYEESEKTVFANWSQIDPGQTADIKIRYKLPFNVMTIKPASNNIFSNLWQNLFNSTSNLLPYSLLVQKQPGMTDSKFIGQVNLNSAFEIIKIWPDNVMKINNNNWQIDDTIDTDKLWAGLFKINN